MAAKEQFIHGEIQRAGLEYFEILSGNGHGKKFSDETYKDLLSLGWITGSNGDTAITDDGRIAEVVLEELMRKADVA